MIGVFDATQLLLAANEANKHLLIKLEKLQLLRQHCAVFPLRCVVTNTAAMFILTRIKKRRDMS